MLQDLLTFGTEQLYRLGESSRLDLGTAKELQNWFNPLQIEQEFGEFFLKGSEDGIRDRVIADRREAVDLIRPGEFRKPSDGRVTSPFGYRKLDIHEKRTFHVGIDLSRSGRIIYAVEDMRIQSILPVDERFPARYRRVNGRWIKVAPEGRAWTPYVKAVGIGTRSWYSYKHIRPRDGLKSGELIRVGEIIGHCGNYGFSFGAHLHFEVWPWRAKKQYNQSFGWSHWPWCVDPRNYLNKKLPLEEKIA